MGTDGRSLHPPGGPPERIRPQKNKLWTFAGKMEGRDGRGAVLVLTM